MSVFKTYSLESLGEFSNRSEKLAIFERDPVKGADEFFQKIMINKFKIKGQVFRNNSYNHIKSLIESVVPKKVNSEPFYSIWLKDMSNMCKYFCNFLKIESVGFSLGTKRVCNRYHVDKVPMRLLLTYAGLVHLNIGRYLERREVELASQRTYKIMTEQLADIETQIRYQLDS